ncbi:MAG TPA: type II toxin-antitoxin system VapC family toxin [Dehalococcoidia bacterium]|nr:type II toxin-antitoxin system VapC family toxin [Dehalococcoidia bacterium]
MTARFLLDSDICINAVRKRNASLRGLVQSIRSEGIAISVVTYGEVREGVIFSRTPVVDMATWDGFVAGLDVIDLTMSIADVWAELRGALRFQGNKLADADLLIAATAMRFGMTLVSGNLRHFGRIAGLDLLVPDR